MKRWSWAVIGPSVLVLATGGAFAHMRWKLDRVESISRVERKTNELNKSALECLSDVGTSLLVVRDSLLTYTGDSVGREFSGSLQFRNRCQSAALLTLDGKLVASVPELALQKYSVLPVQTWGQTGRADEGDSSLPVVEGPYEDPAGEWYVTVRVAYKSTSGSWIAAIIPVNRMFDQSKLKAIIDQNVGIRVSDLTEAEKKSVVLFSLGPAVFLPIIREELPVGQHSIVLEFSPSLDSFLWRSSLVYWSLIVVVAIAAGAIGYEVSSEQRRLKSEVQRCERNLKDVRSQLNQVVGGARKSDTQSVGAAYQDVITGLPNWLYFVTALERSLQRHRANEDMRSTVVLTELEHMPNLQRRLDAAELEDLLRELVSRLEGQLRPADVMATRLGSGEFAFLLFGASHEAAETYLLDMFESALEAPFEVNGKTVILGMLSGVSSSLDTSDGQQLIQHAEVALVKSKLRSTSRQAPSEREAIGNDREFEDVKTAIERDELRLDYLPIVALDGRRLLGLEVLVRWHHPFKGIVSPSRFIPLAEASGQAVFLTKWVLSNSIRQLANWRRTLSDIDDVYISVNLTPHEFGTAGLRSIIEALLEEHSLPAGHLHLELEEEILAGDVKTAITLTQRLQEMGISLAFEEFGAAYTALSSLRSVKWNRVKVGRKYGVGFSTDPEQQRALRALTHMAQDLGIACVAKAVETETAAGDFLSLGYEIAQGFLFHRPIAAQRVEELLKQRPVLAAPTLAP